MKPISQIIKEGRAKLKEVPQAHSIMTETEHLKQLYDTLECAIKVIELYDGIAGLNCDGVSQWSAASEFLAIENKPIRE